MAVWGAGCSTPPRPPVTPVCFGAPPTGWTAALHASTVTPPPGVVFGLGAVAGDLGYGQFTSGAESGVGELDLTSGKLTRIATYAPGVSGLGALAVELPWVVWEQLDSTTNLSDWSVHAWNRATGQSRVLATSRLPDGGYVHGQQPLPVLRHGTVAWAQPVPATSGPVQAQLRLVDLATGRTSTVDSGGLSSPVYAGGYLVWAKVDADRAYAFRAVDEVTGRPVSLPDPLQHPGSVGYLAGSPQYLAWSDQDGTSLRVWPFGATGTGNAPATFTATDRLHVFQFLQLAGHYLLWYGGSASSVLDLTTAAAFDVPGTVTGSADWIVTAVPASAGPTTAKQSPSGSRVSRISTPAAPHIPTCGR
jgi:hypothetical protein